MDNEKDLTTVFKKNLVSIFSLSNTLASYPNLFSKPQREQVKKCLQGVKSPVSEKKERNELDAKSLTDGDNTNIEQEKCTLPVFSSVDIPIVKLKSSVVVHEGSSPICAEQAVIESDTTLNYLREIQIVAELAQRQYMELDRIRKARAVLKSYAVRFRLRKLGNNESVRRRCELFRDLYTAEVQYNKCLGDIIAFFVEPLRKAIETNVIKDTSAEIFGPIEPVYLLGKQFLSMMEIIQEEDWPNFKNVGSMFIALAPLLPTIGSYAHNFPSSREEILTLEKSNPKFASLISSASHLLAEHENVMHQHIIALLTLPMHQIKHYKDTLEEFLSLAETPSESECFSSAHSVVQNIIDLVEMSHELSENRKKVVTLTKRFDNKRVFEIQTTPTAQTLGMGDESSYSRRFVSEGDFEAQFFAPKEKTLPMRSVHYVLFSDCIACCQVSGNTYKLIELYWLKDTKSLFDKDSGTVSLVASGDKSCKMKFFGDIERTLFQATQNAASGLGSVSVFGRHLSALALSSGNQAPQVLILLAKEILNIIALPVKENGVVASDGVFRISTSKAREYQVKEALNEKDWARAKLNNKFTIHDYAATFKSFFAMLPEPLFTFHQYDNIAEFLRLNPTPPNEKVRSISLNLMSSLPQANKGIAEFLFEFLAIVASYSWKHRMTASNLAVVFTPLLFRSKSDDISSAFMCVKMADFVTFLITHYGSLPQRFLPEFQFSDDSNKNLFIVSKLSSKETDKTMIISQNTETSNEDNGFSPQLPPQLGQSKPIKPRSKTNTSSRRAMALSVQDMKALEVAETESVNSAGEPQHCEPQTIETQPQLEKKENEPSETEPKLETQRRVVPSGGRKKRGYSGVTDVEEEISAISLIQAAQNQNQNLNQTQTQTQTQSQIQAQASQPRPNVTSKPSKFNTITSTSNSTTINSSQNETPPLPTSPIQLRKPAVSDKPKPYVIMSEFAKFYDFVPDDPLVDHFDENNVPRMKGGYKKYVELIVKPLPPNISTINTQFYLDENEFESLFNITKEEFVCLPRWKQTQLRRKHKLY